MDKQFLFTFRPTVPDGANLGKMLQEQVDQGAVEVLALLCLQKGDGVLHAPRLLVRPYRRQGVEHVRDGDDASCERNRFAGQTVRIAATAP